MKTIGIDLGGHTIACAEIDISHREPYILRRIEMQTPEERTLPEVLSALIGGISQLACDERELNIGIGVPGFLDKERKKIQKLTNFKGFENIPFPSLLNKKLAESGIDSRIIMENDANCAALGEGLCGAAKGCSDFIVLTLGSGIGAGIISGGKLITGAHGMAGECGHIVISEKIKKCACGGMGHAESFASADRAEAEAKKIGHPADFKLLWQDRDNPKIKTILAPTITSIAKTIATVTVTFDPEITILNGGMSRAEGIVQMLENTAKNYLPTPFTPHLKIEKSKLQADAALYGAVAGFAENI